MKCVYSLSILSNLLAAELHPGPKPQLVEEKQQETIEEKMPGCFLEIATHPFQ